MALSVILVECDVTSPEGVVSTLRFSDRAVFPIGPLDADRANVAWDERVIEPPTLRRTLFDDLSTLEPGLSVGVLILANADRGLDLYQGHIWGDVRVWRWIFGAPFNTARALLTGQAAGSPVYDVQSSRAGRVRLTLFDQRLELEKPLQSNTYGGLNDGETVRYDGDASIRGKPKPLAYGRLLDAHIPAVQVNHAVGAVQLHENAITGAEYNSGLMQFFDRGGDAGLEYGGDTSALDDIYFDENLILGENFVYQSARRGLLKFNANPVGSIALGYRGALIDGVYVETPGPIIRAILERMQIPEARIGASLTAVACDCVIGAFASDPLTAREFVGWIASAGPLAVLPDRGGTWQAVLLRPPGETADLTLTADEVLSLEADESQPLIGGEFAVGWDRLWTTYRRDNLQVELLDTPQETRLAEAYRYAVVEDADFKARSPSWRKMKIDTPLRLEADAAALAATLKTLFGLRADGRPRRIWRVVIEMTNEVLDVELGATVALETPMWGVADRFLLIGEEPLRPRRDQITWTLWG